MPLRSASIILASLAIAACDPSSRDVSVEKSEHSEGVPARYLEGRAGVVILAGQSYPFSIQTCAIGGTGADAAFMVIGEGSLADGQHIGIKADGTPTTVAVVVNRQQPNARAQTYRSSFTPQNVRVDDRNISGSGDFLLRSGETVAGEFSIRCG